jgi:hypothetical protein
MTLVVAIYDDDDDDHKYDDDDLVALPLMTCPEVSSSEGKQKHCLNIHDERSLQILDG